MNKQELLNLITGLNNVIHPNILSCMSAVLNNIPPNLLSQISVNDFKYSEKETIIMGLVHGAYFFMVDFTIDSVIMKIKVPSLNFVNLVSSEFTYVFQNEVELPQLTMQFPSFLNDYLSIIRLLNSSYN